MDNPNGGLELDELRRAMNTAGLTISTGKRSILIRRGSLPTKKPPRLRDGGGTIKAAASRSPLELLAEGALISDDVQPGAAMDAILHQLAVMQGTLAA